MACRMIRTSADKAVETSLFFALLVHVIALFTMAGLLLPGIPGPGLGTVDLRAAYIATHLWQWHLGWLPWHLCALFDLALSLSLLQLRWIPRALSVPTLLLTLAAVAIEQYFEVLWDAWGPHVAATGSIAYSGFESRVSLPVSVIAAVLYAVMAIGWSLCLSRYNTWTRGLTWLSAVTWALLLISSAAQLLPPGYRPATALTDRGNQIGFLLMALWFLLTLEAVLRLTRRTEPYGRMAEWKSAHTGLSGKLLNLLGNSRVLKYAFAFLPSIALQSDVRNVVYLNYLADADRLQRLLPPTLQVQRLGPRGDLAMFSALTYRHGHLGPKIPALRKLMPSPLQSNWRLYVTDTVTNTAGVYFVSTCLSGTPLALLARVASEGIPMHVPREMRLDNEADAGCRVLIDPGTGSAPDLQANLVPSNTTDISGAWKQCFSSFDGLLQYCVPQDQALSVPPGEERTIAQQIRLTAPLSTIRPLAGQVSSRVLRQMLGDSEPICFVIPNVEFHYEGAIAIHHPPSNDSAVTAIA
jgi:hypothetical protein